MWSWLPGLPVKEESAVTIRITDDMMVLEIDNCVVAIARLSEHTAADAGTARGSSRPNAPGHDVNDAANFMNALVAIAVSPLR